MIRLWHQLFLEERPSISLSLFRMVVAFTVWSVVFPSLVHLEELYFQGSFREMNPSFFPVEFIQLVQKSPDSLVMAFAVLFHVSIVFFFFGFLSQWSCIAVTACCYYFYALNSFHVHTLSWDILLVTLFMMCVTGYHGDYFSIDSLIGKDAKPWARKRPYFVQRLLQMQLAFTFFYTALYKTTAEGNWLTDNPLFYVISYPPEGVAKTFLLKDFLQTMPQLVYWSGIAIVVLEFLMPFLLWWRKTRLSAIYLGIFFQTLLVLTLDVPATFFFLFPAMFLLFIDPKEIADWIQARRQYHASAQRMMLLYDGSCGLCKASLEVLKKMDLFGVIEYKSFHDYIEADQPLPAGLTNNDVFKQMFLIEGGRAYGGFHAVRRMCWHMPMLALLIPLIYFPGSGIVGPAIYGQIAKNRKCLLKSNNS